MPCALANRERWYLTGAKIRLAVKYSNTQATRIILGIEPNNGKKSIYAIKPRKFLDFEMTYDLMRHSIIT